MVTKKDTWIMVDAPMDTKKREYLLYLLSIEGYKLDPEVRNVEEWKESPHILNNSEYAGITIYNMYTSYPTIEVFSSHWPRYEVVSYDTLISQLEEKLNSEYELNNEKQH
jgi:hypothetical protein